MSTCLVKLDPRTLSVALSRLDPRERATLISLLAHMWCLEGHVANDDKFNALICGLRPSSYKKSLAKLLTVGMLNVVNGRIYPGRKMQQMMRRVGLTPEQRARVLTEERACRYCLTREEPLVIDHIFPASRGGTNHRLNLTLACVPCNISKWDMALHEMEDANG